MTLRIDVISLMPDLVQAVGNYGVTGRAMERQLLSLHLWNPRDYATDRHKTVDDRAYGGGPGMVMKPEPLSAAMQAAINAAELPAKRIYLSPQGRRFDHQAALDFSKQHRLILLAGRYEGIDERFIQTEIDEEWSLGDYVLSGGELGAMVIIDAVARLLPGALGDADSAAQDSFAEVLLDHPHFTRPEDYLGNRVPEVLLSGDHAAIARWRRMQALGRTEERRPDLLEKLDLDATDRALLDQYRQATNNLQTGE